jgi:hypothetical protein
MDRIVEDVFERGLVLLLRFDRLRPVAAPEDVILAPVALVEGAGIAAVQVAHALVEVGRGRLDHEVEVVPHQAADVDAPAVAALDTPEEVEEDHPVLAVDDDRRVVVPAASDVVVAAGNEVTAGTSHRPDRSAARSELIPAGAFRATSGAAQSRARHEAGPKKSGPG